MWPFLLPPLLSYLDDYESANRIRGVVILDNLLTRVDASLLRRTGVGKVFERVRTYGPVFTALHRETEEVQISLAVTRIVLLGSLRPERASPSRHRTSSCAPSR